MSDTTKRLDLQFGSFACSVQGFDDPVQPVQQVLQALQNMMEETPQLGDAALSFDAEAIERLIGEVARRADLQEKNVEIVPGLIIVHRGDAVAAPEEFDQAREDADDGGEAWSRPFVGGNGDSDTRDTGATESAESEVTEDVAAGYVNIFAPGAQAGGDAGSDSGAGMFMAAADYPEGSGGDEAAGDNDPFAARLGRITAAGADSDARTDDAADGGSEHGRVRDIFADPANSADGGTGGSVFADPMAANISGEPVDDEAAVNFFAASDDTDEDADGTRSEIGDEPGAAHNVFASHQFENSAADSDVELRDDEAESERGEALFGRSDDQPEVEEADEGYTAAGLAETAGAKTVAELMVSAAAWMVLIQGRTTFTRHDVIEVFESMPGEHSKTLEARIKGFGKAVRNDQLIMVEDGVFGLSRTELERFQRLL